MCIWFYISLLDIQKTFSLNSINVCCNSANAVRTRCTDVATLLSAFSLVIQKKRTSILRLTYTTKNIKCNKTAQYSVSYSFWQIFRIYESLGRCADYGHSSWQIEPSVATKQRKAYNTKRPKYTVREILSLRLRRKQAYSWSINGKPTFFVYRLTCSFPPCDSTFIWPCIEHSYNNFRIRTCR